MAETGVTASKGAQVPGEKLVGLKYTHCLAPHLPGGRRSPRTVITTDFVDMSTGTGIVHIAPGHGEEDFHAGKKWGLEVFCPVDEAGRFTKDAGIFEGLKVFEANGKILETLKSDGLLPGCHTSSLIVIPTAGAARLPSSSAPRNNGSSRWTSRICAGPC